MFDSVSPKRLTKEEAKRLFGLEKQHGLYQADDLYFERLPSLKEIVMAAYNTGVEHGCARTKQEIRKVLGI